MSELQTRFIDDTYVEYYNTGKHELAQIYLKSEADKVISEKDAEIAQLQAMLEERNSQIAKLTQSLEQVKRAARTLRKKMNHWKRKFCEAMARERGIAAQMQHDFLMRYENPLYVKRAEWCEKWRDIWKSLVDKFKEAK